MVIMSAEIAHYLLKGWCLLNDYCDKGHNTPLVRSRDGKTLCVSCEAEAHKVSQAIQLEQQTAPKSDDTQKVPSETAIRSDADPTEGDEMILRAQGLRLNCIVLEAIPGQRAQLQGRSYELSVRVAGPLLPGFVLEHVKKIALEECNKLSGRVLLPDRSGTVKISPLKGGHSVLCDHGLRMELPEGDSVSLSMRFGSHEELAGVICSRLSATSAETLRGANARWMELCLSENLGNETTIRRQVR